MPKLNYNILLYYSSTSPTITYIYLKLRSGRSFHRASTSGTTTIKIANIHYIDLDGIKHGLRITKKLKSDKITD